MTDVRAIRRQLGLSQGQLAEKLGVNQSSISRFETGELPIDGRTALALDAIMLRGGGRPPSSEGSKTVLCATCDKRAEDPRVASCAAADCPMARAFIAAAHDRELEAA